MYMYLINVKDHFPITRRHFYNVLGIVTYTYGLRETWNIKIAMLDIFMEEKSE